MVGEERRGGMREEKDQGYIRAHSIGVVKGE